MEAALTMEAVTHSSKGKSHRAGCCCSSPCSQTGPLQILRKVQAEKLHLSLSHKPPLLKVQDRSLNSSGSRKCRRLPLLLVLAGRFQWSPRQQPQHQLHLFLTLHTRYHLSNDALMLCPMG